LNSALNVNKQYGVVLEGGGAKGAYQIGVLQALKDTNINIKAIVGTSVGALNGALMVQNDLEEATRIWKNIKYSHVVDVEDKILEKISKFDFKDLDFKRIFNKFMQFIKDRGVDITPLKNLIAETIDEEKIRNSKTKFGLVTVSLSDRKPLELYIEDIEDGKLHDFLLASSYLPVFKNEKLHGKTYLDGGFYNNSPISMLIDKGYKDIIVIKINGIGFDKKADLEGINVFEISPSENLGGILEFDTEKTNYNINLGYFDTIRRLKELKGKYYYISINNNEEYFMYKILNMNYNNKMKYYNFFNLKNKSINRAMFEDVIPRLSRKLGMKDNWNYTDFIIEVIEYFAKKLQIPKFKIYSYDEFIIILRNKIRKAKLDLKEDKIFLNLLEDLVFTTNLI
jgi:NTE family protein